MASIVGKDDKVVVRFAALVVLAVGGGRGRDQQSLATDNPLLLMMMSFMYCSKRMMASSSYSDGRLVTLQQYSLQVSAVESCPKVLERFCCRWQVIDHYR